MSTNEKEPAAAAASVEARYEGIPVIDEKKSTAKDGLHLYDLEEDPMEVQLRDAKNQSRLDNMRTQIHKKLLIDSRKEADELKALLEEVSKLIGWDTINALRAKLPVPVHSEHYYEQRALSRDS
jgi:hypothetical protein